MTCFSLKKCEIVLFYVRRNKVYLCGDTVYLCGDTVHCHTNMVLTSKVAALIFTSQDAASKI